MDFLFEQGKKAGQKKEIPDEIVENEIEQMMMEKHKQDEDNANWYYEHDCHLSPEDGCQCQEI